MIGNIKRILSISIALLILGGAFFAYRGYDSYVKMKDERDRYIRVSKAYSSIINKSKSDKRALELTVSDLRHSNDSIILELEKVRKSLKSPENKPGDVSVNIDTSISASDTSKIENKCDFELDTTIFYNKLTKNHIKIKKDSLVTSIDVNNNMKLYVYSHREYVNEYKSGWHRFWRFDWKKEDVDRYEIVNDNDIIKNNNIVVVKVK